MFGYTYEYSGQTAIFNILIRNKTNILNSNNSTPFNSGFGYVPCEDAMLDTLNIYNYQFLFDDVFGNILYDFMNKTKFPAAMEEIMPFKNMFQESFETELGKLNSSLIENSTERNIISHLISTMGNSYLEITKNGTVENFHLKPNSMLKHVRHLIKDSFDNLYETLYNVVDDDPQDFDKNESESNYITLYWQKIRSGYDTVKKVVQHSYVNETFLSFQNVSIMWNSDALGETYLNDYKVGNESRQKDTIFSWFSNTIEKETNRFKSFIKPYTNISMYF